MKNPKSDGRLSKSEIEYLLRALRANVKAAKAGILGLEPRLQTEFEQELNKFIRYRMIGSGARRSAL